MDTGLKPTAAHVWSRVQFPPGINSSPPHSAKAARPILGQMTSEHYRMRGGFKKRKRRTYSRMYASSNVEPRSSLEMPALAPPLIQSSPSSIQRAITANGEIKRDFIQELLET